jgi:formylglycine-generating enzyme required for sulfatase activity
MGAIDPGVFFAPAPPTLVILSPFFADQKEATVFELRESGVATAATVLRWSGGEEGTSPEDYCAYTDASGPRDELPVNCLSFAAAEAFCASRGGVLLSEAQFEYLAGALASQPYPWGFDPPSCTDAVWGRLIALDGFRAPCGDQVDVGRLPGQLPVEGNAGGPEAHGRDITVLPDGDVVDLAGNLSEWTRDAFEIGEPACWLDPDVHIYADPTCATRGAARHAGRGGSYFSQQALLLSSARREGYESTALDPQLGVRCARPAARR